MGLSSCKTMHVEGGRGEQHVIHPALGPGRVFVWVTWLVLPSVLKKNNRGGMADRLRSCYCLCQDGSLPSAAVTLAQSAQAVQL